MPYFVDLEKRANKLMHLTVQPYGWIFNNEQKTGVDIEFGWVWLDGQHPQPSMCMRVKGTTHVWAWFKDEFKYLASDNYADFFKKQLEEFRIEFLLWTRSPAYAGCGWVAEYYEIFKGRFYNFSEEEERQYEESLREWQRHQDEIDTAARDAERGREEERMWNQWG